LKSGSADVEVKNDDKEMLINNVKEEKSKRRKRKRRKYIYIYRKY
jgi:hypothetical protein